MLLAARGVILKCCVPIREVFFSSCQQLGAQSLCCDTGSMFEVLKVKMPGRIRRGRVVVRALGFQVASYYCRKGSQNPHPNSTLPTPRKAAFFCLLERQENTCSDGGLSWDVLSAWRMAGLSPWSRLPPVCDKVSTLESTSLLQHSRISIRKTNSSQRRYECLHHEVVAS